MKTSFVQKKDLSELKKSVAVLILSEEEVKNTQLEYIKTTKEFFGFEGKSGEAKIVFDKQKPIVIVGIGAQNKIDKLALQKCGSAVVAFLNAQKIADATVYFESDNEEDDLCNIAFGAILQSYRFNKYFVDKLQDKEFKVSSLNFAVKEVKKAKKQFEELEILANNILFARDLVSEPANILNPESYAEICKKLTKDGLKVEILGEKEMQKLGMNSLLAVGQGSSKESKLVVLKWNGGKRSDKPLAFVGKGVTFDTGGISIKPSANMEDMKSDMGGSAVVVGLLKNLAQRKAKINAVGVVGLVENMPSGDAQRPGDVVTSMSGQTIEVINTDAEGRMVLADALHYTNTKFKPELIVDLATLTGAIIVCLADIYAGLFSNDDNLANDLIKSGENTGEKLWRMPIGEDYDKMINSDIADMKNVGSGRGAGSTTAAQFLKRFIGETKWAHLDIAGVALKGKGDAFAIKGATGFGVNLLNDLVKKYEAK